MHMESKKRYDNIDFMKGVCILLVVAAHIDMPLLSHPCFSLFRMPLYYFLSGIFFSRYDGFKTFLIKKTNNLLIPYLFFSLISLAILLIYYFCKFGNAQEAYEKSIPLYNAPVWFLVSLFEVGVFMFFVSGIKRLCLQFCLVVVLSLIGYYICEKEIVLPFFLNTALCSIVFYYAGFLLRRKNLLDDHRHIVGKCFLSLALFILIAFCIIPGKELSLISYKIPYAYSWFFLSGLTGTLSLFYFSKIVHKFSVVNYLGRYSIIVLGTHWYYVKTWAYIISPVILATWWCRSLIFLFAIMVSFPTIYILKKYLPWLTAQKPLIKLPK